jgi:hypothetical protein
MDDARDDEDRGLDEPDPEGGPDPLAVELDGRGDELADTQRSLDGGHRSIVVPRLPEELGCGR